MIVSYVGPIYQKPITLIANAARICRNGENDFLLRTGQFGAHISMMDQEKDLDTVIRCLEDGHEIVLETLSDIKFYIQDISRACLAQLHTHRLRVGSLTQSQRYCKMDKDGDFWNNHYIPDLEYLPPAAKDCAIKEFIKAYEEDRERYIRLSKLGVRPEDNRYHTAQAGPTTTIISFNLREFLLCVYPLRSSRHAQSEIRKLAENMLEELIHRYSNDILFKKFITHYLEIWLPRKIESNKHWARLTKI